MEEDHLFQLNYSITLFNNEDLERAAAHYNEFELLYEKLDDEARNSDPEVTEQRSALRAALSAAGFKLRQAAPAAPSSGQQAARPAGLPAPPPKLPNGGGGGGGAAPTPFPSSSLASS